MATKTKSKKTESVPKVRDGDVLGWFERMAMEHGDHPLTLASSDKVMKEAGISRKQLTAATLRKAVRATLGPAKAHAAKHNADPNRRGFVIVHDTDWLTFCSPAGRHQPEDN